MADDRHEQESFELAGFRIGRLVGSGGQADVFLGEDVELGRPVALKLLTPGLSSDQRFRDQFIRESRLAASLDHPHVIPIYEAGEADGHLFIAMRFVDGTDLRRLLDQDGPLDAARALALLTPVADALDAAHARGLVHRDVKPSNILIAIEPSDGSQHVYLADFGLTRHASEGRNEEGFSGSPEYSAPEVLEHAHVDGRADQYALCCVLVECMTGRPPFDGRTMQVVWEHLERDPPRPSERVAALPAAFDSVVARALAKNPVERFGSCKSMCDSARDALGLSERRLSRRALLAGAGAAVVVVGAAVAVPLSLTRGRSGTPARPSVALPLGEHSLLQIEATTGQLVGATPLGAAAGPLAVTEDAVWVASSDDGQLLEIDRAALTVTRRVDAADVGNPNVIAAGQGAVWLIDRNDKLSHRAFRYEVDSGSLTAFPTGAHTHDNLEFAGAALWAGCDEIIRIEPETRQITATVPLPGAVLATGEGSLWAGGKTGVLVGQGPSLLWRIDPATANVLSETELEPGLVDLAVGARAVWTVNLTTDSITRVDAETLRASEGFRVRQPKAVAADNRAVWVASARDGTMTRYDAETADVRTIDVGGTPIGVVVDGPTVWVTVAA